MDILLVTHGFPPDQMAGAEIYAFHQAREMIRRGHAVTVFCPGHRPDAGDYGVVDETVDGIAVRRMHRSWTDQYRLEDTYRCAPAEAVFTAELDRHLPDVVHVHHVIGTSSRVIPMARERGIPVVVTLHDFWFHCARGQRLTPRNHLCTEVQPWRCALCVGKKRGRYAFDWVRASVAGRSPESRGQSAPARWAMALPRLAGQLWREAGPGVIHRRLAAMAEDLDAASLVIAPSRFLRDRFVERGHDPDRVVFSEYGMDLDRVASLAPLRAGDRDGAGPVRFGYVGSLLPSKGVMTLVRAFQGLPAGAATLDVWGAGGGPNAARDERSLQAANRRDDVRFRGRFDNERIGEVLSSLDVLCVPSLWYENAPLTLHEAAIAGLPVITSDHGGMKELAERYGNALTFRPGDAASLAAALRRFLDEPELLTTLADPERPVRGIDDDVAWTLATYERLRAGDTAPGS